MDNPKQLKTYLIAYEDAITDCLDVVTHWQNIAHQEKYTDVDWLVSMMEVDINDIQQKVKNLTDGVDHE